MQKLVLLNSSYFRRGMEFYWILLFALFSTSACIGAKNASVTYDQQTHKFIIHDFIADNYVAYGNFENEISLTGWSYLEVKSSEQFPDPIQAYAAGLVEGYLTADLLTDHSFNMVSNYCDKEEAFCLRLKEFIRKNINFINTNVQTKRKYDIYWHQVALTFEQLQGLEDGYKNKTSQPSKDLDSFELLLLNLAGDLIDLEKILDRTKTSSLAKPSCSGLVKVLPKSSDIYFGHTTWTNYNAMLRILKKYSLKFHTAFTEGSPVIPGHTYSFSSQPGVLNSMDDFYLISSGLAVFETTIHNYNTSLWKFVSPEKIILTWQRSIIANRLAENGEQWVSIFSIMNSGTYNNQWNVLDYNKFKPGKPLQDGLLWTLEQLPGFVRAEDLTSILRKQSYFPSYNIPYFKEIFNMSCSQENVIKYGDYFTYERSPRSLIFKRDQGNVKDIQTMTQMMRYNDYERDPISVCNCTPSHNAHKSISSRSDLNPENGTYPFDTLKHGCHGGIDSKITSYGLFKNLKFVAVAGPTYDPLPPFQWSQSDFDKKVKHRGHPDVWNFKPIVHEWM